MLMNGSLVDPNSDFSLWCGSGSDSQLRRIRIGIFLCGRIYRPSPFQGELQQLHCEPPQLQDTPLGLFTADPDPAFHSQVSGSGIFYSAGFMDPHGASVRFHSSTLMRIYADPGEHPPFSPSPSTIRPVLIPSLRPNSHKKRWIEEKGTNSPV